VYSDTETLTKETLLINFGGVSCFYVNMEQNFNDHIHIYMGCRCVKYIDGKEDESESVFMHQDHIKVLQGSLKVKPILRRLSDMTEEESEEIGLNPTYPHVNFNPFEFIYLVDNGFDLFGLIDLGLAIEDKIFTQNKN
jgi:hypothetical protein